MQRYEFYHMHTIFIDYLTLVFNAFDKKQEVSVGFESKFVKGVEKFCFMAY